MPILPCCARPFRAPHYSTSRDFFDDVAKGTDESTLRRIVMEGAPVFVGGRGFTLVVPKAELANAGKPADIRLERNWREFGWFRRVVLTLLSCVVPRDRQHCERPYYGQLSAISQTITRLRQRASIAVPAVPPPPDEPPLPAGPNAGHDASAVEPGAPISPVLSPEACRARLIALAARIRSATSCKLFPYKEEWCKVVREIAGNDPPECLDAVAAVVLAQMAGEFKRLHDNREKNEAAYAEVLAVLEALFKAADARDDVLAEVAARLTAVWKRHWWRGEIAEYSAFGQFQLPVEVARRIGAVLREHWGLVTNVLGALDRRDRQIQRLMAAAGPGAATANAIGPAAPSLAIG